jgi:hypothetical protein
VQFTGTYDFASSYPDIFAFKPAGVRAANGSFAGGQKPIIGNTSGTTQRFRVLLIGEEQAPRASTTSRRPSFRDPTQLATADPL